MSQQHHQRFFFVIATSCSASYWQVEVHNIHVVPLQRLPPFYETFDLAVLPRTFSFPQDPLFGK
jgi:hypothetical protein